MTSTNDSVGNPLGQQRSSETPEVSTLTSSDQPSKVDALFSMISREIYREMNASNTDSYFPHASPLLVKELTFEGDASIGVRDYADDFIWDEPEAIVLKAHPANLKPPVFGEPIQTAIATKEAVALQPSILRANGPCDLNGCVLPIVTSLGSALTQDFTWDFCYPILRLFEGYAFCSSSYDNLGVDKLSGATFSLPGMPAFKYMTLPLDMVGQFLSGRIHVSHVEFDPGRTYLVPLPEWSKEKAAIGYAMWTGALGPISATPEGETDPIYFAGASTAPRTPVMNVVFVSPDFTVSDENYVGGSGNPATWATTDKLPLDVEEYRSMLRWMQYVIQDDWQFVRAGAIAAARSPVVFGDSADNLALKNFFLTGRFTLNPPNSLAFILLQSSVMATKQSSFEIAPPSRWMAPAVRRWWFAIESIAAVARVSPIDILLGPAQGGGHAATRIFACRSKLNDLLSLFGVQLDVVHFNDNYEPQLPVVQSPLSWFADLGFDVFKLHSKWSWKVGPGSTLYHLASEAFKADDLCASGAQVVGGTSLVRYLTPERAGTVLRILGCMGCSEDGLLEANATGQFRPYSPAFTLGDQPATGCFDDTLALVGTRTEVATFTAYDYLPPRFLITAIPSATEVIAPSFLGQDFSF